MRYLNYHLQIFYKGLRWLGGCACARARGLIRRRLLPDVCSCCVSRNASVSVAWRGLIVACRDLHINCFFSIFWGLAILKKFKTETRVYRTKFGIVTFILKPLGRYCCWWTVRSQGYHQPSASVFQFWFCFFEIKAIT